MKIRLDFVTNSSSSSFVCIQFKSKKLKELLSKYDVQYWKSDEEWDVCYEDEDVSCTAMSQNNIGRTLDWFMENLLLMMNSENGFINEYREKRQIFIDDITEAIYKIDETNRNEFAGSPELHDIFEYKKGKTSEKQIKECIKNLKNNYSITTFKPVKREQYLGELHLEQATDESDIVLVRELGNTDDQNAIFVEEKPHRYMGYFWHGITENLAPILDSGQYLYKATVDNNTKGIYVEFEKADANKPGWKRIEAGLPQISNEELGEVKNSFDQWLSNLKSKYEGKKKPASIDTIFKNGGIPKNYVKEWAKALNKGDLPSVLIGEGLLDPKKNYTYPEKWDRCNESDDAYYKRIRSAVAENIVTPSKQDLRGKTFVNFTGRYRGWAAHDVKNPIRLAVKKAGGKNSTSITDDVDYLIVDISKKPDENILMRGWVEYLKKKEKGLKAEIIILDDFEKITGIKE